MPRNCDEIVSVIQSGFTEVLSVKDNKRTHSAHESVPKSSCEVVPGSYFCQRTLHGEGQRCLCDEDAKLFTLIGLRGTARAVHTDSLRTLHLPWKKKEKEKKNRTNKDVLWVCSLIWIFFYTIYESTHILKGHYYFTHNFFFSYRST